MSRSTQNMIALALLSALTSPFTALADGTPSSILTPFQLQLSWADLSSILFQNSAILQGSADATIPDFTAGNPVPVKLSGIHIHVDYAFNPPSLNPQTQVWEFNSKGLSAELFVQHIDANTVTHHNEGGTNVTVHTSGTCDNIHFSLAEGSSTANGKLLFQIVDGKPILNLTALEGSWTPGSWQVTSLNCQGPNGIGDIISQNAELQLRQIDPFLQDIHDQIQNWFNQKFTSPVTLDFNVATHHAQVQSPYPVPANPVSGHLKVQTFTDLTQATSTGKTGDVILSGTGSFDFPDLGVNSGCGSTIPTFNDVPVVDHGVHTDSLTLPMPAFQAMLACAQINGSLFYQFDSTQVPTFQNLFSGGAATWIFWPDLQNFSSKDVFKFTAQPMSVPILTQLSSTIPHAITAQMTLPARADLHAPHNGTYNHYMALTSDLSGQALFTIIDGKVTVTRTGSPLTVTNIWDPSYVAAFQPNTRVGTDKIASSLTDTLASPGFTINLPSFEIGPAVELRLNDGALSGANLKIGVSVTHSPAHPAHPAK